MPYSKITGHAKQTTHFSSFVAVVYLEIRVLFTFRLIRPADFADAVLSNQHGVILFKRDSERGSVVPISLPTGQFFSVLLCPRSLGGPLLLRVLPVLDGGVVTHTELFSQHPLTAAFDATEVRANSGPTRPLSIVLLDAGQVAGTILPTLTLTPGWVFSPVLFLIAGVTQPKAGGYFTAPLRLAGGV